MRFSSHKLLIKIILLLLALVIFSLISLRTKNKTISPTPPPPAQTTKPDEPFGMYTPPVISKKDTYIIFMVGDSMTEELGEFGGQITEELNKDYESTPGHQRIVIDNYATGSTNLLGLPIAMTEKKVNKDKTLDPLLSRHFDLILIESFGYNPLSQLGIDEGLKKQTATLDQVMKLLTKTHPDAAIMFVATIAPNKETYGKEIDPNTSVEGRTKEAEERMAYIRNHIEYAKIHHIPLIDIFNKSLTSDGDGDLKYINPVDHIHPSFEGAAFISQQIANTIYESNILPK